MDNFVNRLTHLLEHYEHTASSFSDSIGVQRSSLSHLLSGRNKPSLDFIMKIHETFPEVNLYWLLKGEKPFINGEEKNSDSEKKQIEKIEIPKTHGMEFSTSNQSILENEERKKQETIQQYPSFDPRNPIEQIVVFYKNGTFKNFNPTR